MLNKDKLVVFLIVVIILLVGIVGYIYINSSTNMTANMTNNTTNATDKGTDNATAQLIDSGSMNGTFSGQWGLNGNYTYTWKAYRYNDSYIKIYTTCKIHNSSKIIDQTITLSKEPPGTLTIFIEPKMTGTGNYMTTVHTTMTARKYYFNVWKPSMVANGPSH